MNTRALKTSKIYGMAEHVPAFCNVFDLSGIVTPAVPEGEDLILR